MPEKQNGPACGNNPNYPLSDGDRAAVAEFRAYLAARAARQKLYEDAVRTAGDTAYGNGPFYEAIAKAVVAVADAEQALLLARIAELEAAPADRAAVRDSQELAELDREGAELVCVDQCGNCDACGRERFGTPAEGWREAARFLRRTPRESNDFLGAVRGARLIEDELRRRADKAQQTGGQP